MTVSNRIIRRMAGVFAAVGLLATAGALEMPPEVSEAFRRASTGEEGYLMSPGNGRQLIIDYVGDHWRELLDGLEQVPSPSGEVQSAAIIVGLAAEELPPAEYVDFLEHYLTIYSRGLIRDEILQLQLGGRDRKNHFVAVNAEHSRVRALLLRAKELVPKENADFQTDLGELLAGKRSDMYLANKGDDAAPPETLSGIKLRSPFESLINKAKRMGQLGGRDEVRSDKGSAGPSEAPEGATTGKARGGGRVWSIAAALAVLAFALWRAFFKRRLAGTSP